MRFDVENVEGAIVVDDDTLVVRVFPSNVVLFKSHSRMEDDWMRTNFRARPLRAGHYWFHRGFLQAWMLIEDIVLVEIQKTKPTRLLLEGLSMGAAVSGVGAALLAERGYRVNHQGYATPKFVIGRKSVARFNASVNSRQWIFGRDIVPRLAPFYRKCGVIMHTIPARRHRLRHLFRDHEPQNYDILNPFGDPVIL